MKIDCILSDPNDPHSFCCCSAESSLESLCKRCSIESVIDVNRCFNWVEKKEDMQMKRKHRLNKENEEEKIERS